MRYSGMANVPGAPGNFPIGAGGLSDLVYRGEPVQAMPLPYYGGQAQTQLLAQGQPIPGAQRTLKEIFGDRAGGMSDIPGDVRIRRDTQFLPYDPNNYTMNDRSNPLRKYQWPYGMPEGLMPGIRPYFGRYQGPGLQGEVGTGAI